MNHLRYGRCLLVLLGVCWGMLPAVATADVFQDELQQGLCGLMTLEALDQFFQGRQNGQTVILDHARTQALIEIQDLPNADLPTVKDILRKLVESAVQLHRLALRDDALMLTKLARCLLAVRKGLP